MNLSGYHVDGLLYESRHSRIYRARRAHDGLAVVCKTLSEELPSAEQRARFQQEFKLMQQLQSDAILRAHAMVLQQGRQIMILEDFNGVSLNNLGLAGTLPLGQWLALAIRIAACLGQLHERRIMHKDINPSNIVWNRHTGQIKLIDLGIATQLSREVKEIRNPEWLEGTLSYLSPEQTGRMNRAMDYRSDFYSLGVTFYELLTGRLPFPTTDALELVHAHIAREPVPAAQCNPAVPLVLSQIIGKLMAKTAEERYQSAAGLEADLQRCLDTLDADGNIPGFALGSKDFFASLSISQKLYGRATQLATLLDAFGRASQGPAELVLVAGYSGVGKSALVHEIQKTVLQKQGFFIEGKFDQFKRNIPYTSFIQAFDELIRQLLTEGEDAIDGWRQKLLHALGNNGQVIVDVIPDVRFIIGPQPAVVDLPPQLAQNRFNQTFRNFVEVFASAERPLAIFMDDLQWVDLPSLQLMALLLRAPATSHLLLIGAYRDNEITAAHALFVTLKELEKNGAVVPLITLPPLGLQEVRALLGDSLHADTARVTPLAQLCFAKTKGNPFFLSQFLGTLVDSGMLYPDPASSRWQWRIASIEQAGITDNVVDFMLERLHRLPLVTQQILQGAACLGNAFDLAMLATVCGLDEVQTAAMLWHALTQELIIPLDNLYHQAEPAGAGQTARHSPAYRFLHDRVQQASYMLCNDADKAQKHLAIGRLWMVTFSTETLQGMVFDLVNHLNRGRALITDPAERRQVARLNLSAARKAKASAAYKPALTYLQAALELVDQRDWQAHYDLMLGLHLEAAEAAYLSIETAEMQRHLDAAFPHVSEILDQAKLHEIRIQAQIAEADYRQALTGGLAVLRLLGVPFPEKPTRMDIAWSLLRTKFAFSGTDIGDLQHQPNVADPRILAITNVMTKTSTAAFYIAPDYVPLFIFEAVRLSLEYGPAPTSAYYYAGYGLTSGALFGNVEQMAYYRELAARLLERPAMAPNVCRTMCVIYACLDPWTIPLAAILEPLRQNYLRGMEIGDMEFAGHTAALYCCYAFHSGHGLLEFEHEAAAYSRSSEQQLQNNSAVYAIRIWWQAAQNLMGRAADSHILLGDVLTTHHLQKLALMQNEPILQFNLGCAKLIMCCLFRDKRGALDHARQASSYVASAMGFFGLAYFHFYDSLAHLAVLDGASRIERAIAVHKVRKNQKKLRSWARHAPENLLHKWYLVEAELARHAGKPLPAWMRTSRRFG